LVLRQNIAVEDVLWRNSKWASKAIAMTIAGLAVIWVAVPFLWAIDNSLKSDADIFRPGAIIPFLRFTPRLDMWIKVLFDPQLQKCLGNSAFVGVTSTVFVLLIGTPAAYSLARFEFKRVSSKDMALWFLSQRVLPPVVVLSPFYILLAESGLIDTRIGLMLLYITFNLNFCVIIMRDIFRDVSKEVEEAARIEGASLWQVFWMIALPLSLDGLIVTAFIVFAFCWNEALFASAVTTQHAVTMPAFILASRDSQGIRFNFAAVNTILAISPPVILSLLVQRYLARGLSFGAVKA
jgi:multiple sugar transport system permease protein